jgi:hypothetical protein
VDGFLCKVTIIPLHMAEISAQAQTELMGTHSTEESAVDIRTRSVSNTLSSWSKPSRNSEVISSERTQRFSLQIDDLVFKEGCIRCINTSTWTPYAYVAVVLFTLHLVLGPTGTGRHRFCLQCWPLGTQLLFFTY